MEDLGTNVEVEVCTDVTVWRDAPLCRCLSLSLCLQIPMYAARYVHIYICNKNTCVVCIYACFSPHISLFYIPQENVDPPNQIESKSSLVWAGYWNCKAFCVSTGCVSKLPDPNLNPGGCRYLLLLLLLILLLILIIVISRNQGTLHYGF